ncbi:SDR family oxidoreductase [Ancylobacter pratisalsi]|uniref:SDR family oxidoreductase n=1 Tax=Ancylobacter pratisalsi TaxID=1745854 RepID=A0A6P1YP69_9HYPH|nr:SDR family oxidoreductase [Ancylobacter pratisalsi]QIB35169.1 SDR family oxidoreductase [Ancylobacter pratisalsi]
MTDPLSGKTVIVTGATGGIGGACVRALFARGANVTLVDRSPERLAALAAEGGDRALALVLDVASEEDMARMAAETIERFGAIDTLISAAGILRTGGQPRMVSDTSFDEWKTILSVNLTGTFLSNRAVLGQMTKQGQGDIVNVSSTSGRQGRPFDAAYCASKFGVVGFSESLAEEVGRIGIRVQTLLPDAVDTPLWEQSGTAAIRPRELLTPERVAEVILYLITLPRDTYLLNPTLYPSRQRARRRAAAPAVAGGEAVS